MLFKAAGRKRIKICYCFPQAASQELDEARKHQSQLTDELEQLRYKAENIEELHMKQDELLGELADVLIEPVNRKL